MLSYARARLTVLCDGERDLLAIAKFFWLYAAIIIVFAYHVNYMLVSMFAQQQ